MNDLIFFTDSVFHSYAQIFFSNRKWFGAMALAASMIETKIGMICLFGIVLSNLTAFTLRFDNAKIRSGFYGFNGLLISAAALYYYQMNLSLLLLLPLFIILAFLISAVIEHFFAAALNLPGLSLPFLITLYIFIYFLYNIPDIHPVIHSYKNEGFIKTYFNALSLIILQPGWIAGVIIALAIFMFSRISIILSILNFIAGYYFLQLILPQHFDSLIVVVACNSILTGFALGGALIIPSRKSLALSIIANLLVVVLAGFFLQYLWFTPLPLLVLPFNFIVLATIYGLKFRQEHSELTLLYFPPGAPEENYYYHHNKRQRFKQFKLVFPELPVFGEWKVSQGLDGRHTHKKEWKNAWDFVVTDSEGEEYSGNGLELSDYYCHKLPVLAPLDGTVVKVVDHIPNNEIGDVNIAKNWGNSIIIKHAEGFYSALSHLEPESIKVKEGEHVSTGTMVAHCGSSGRSPVPHLHFQFQLNDKLGAHTYRHPIAHYIEKEDGHFRLQTFDFPSEDSVVANIETNNALKQTFDFKYETTYQWKCKSAENEFDEKWEVKVNISNSLYIESDRGAVIYLFTTPKVLYLSDFVGNRDSALYYFYLAAARVPFTHQKNLLWNDMFPPTIFRRTLLHYISELLLVIKPMIAVTGAYRFGAEHGNDIVIESEIEIAGSEPFAFYRKLIKGQLQINEDGGFKEISFRNDNLEIFNAQFISE